MAVTDGMTVRQVLDNDAISVHDKIAYLKKKTINVPNWEVLKKEYYKKYHPVKTSLDYVDTGKEKKCRITFGWQKLATKRMAALLCGIPVKRVYYPNTDEEKRAAAILEDIYKRNRIGSVNLERAESLYAACEIVTIWYTQEQPTLYAGEKSLLKLRCRTYSPKDGAKLYPLFDEYDDLVALSVEYTRNENNLSVTYFECYTDEQHVVWKVNNQSEVLRQKINIGKIAGVYVHRSEPVWEEESDNVYEVEWMFSRNGNYIRKNSRPQLALYTDGKPKVNKSNSEAARDIVRLGKDDKLEYVTWQGSIDAIKFQSEQLQHNFNSQLQLPDMSMDNMKQSPMSGESRKMLFIDAEMKVTSEAGIWMECYDRETNVIKAFAKQMFPSLASAFDSLSVEHIITPYQIRDEKEKVETLATACGTIASKQTCIKRLGWTDDIDEEVGRMQEESVNNIFEQAE